MSSLKAPEKAPVWSIIGGDEVGVVATGGTPHGETGVGDNARRNIRTSYTAQDIIDGSDIDINSDFSD